MKTLIVIFILFSVAYSQDSEKTYFVGHLSMGFEHDGEFNMKSIYLSPKIVDDKGYSISLGCAYTYAINKDTASLGMLGGFISLEIPLIRGKRSWTSFRTGFLVGRYIHYKEWSIGANGDKEIDPNSPAKRELASYIYPWFGTVGTNWYYRFNPNLTGVLSAYANLHLGGYPYFRVWTWTPFYLETFLGFSLGLEFTFRNKNEKSE